MKKMLIQFIKQIMMIIAIIVIIVVLNNIFVKSSIKGEYETITVGITKGEETRNLKKYLTKSFKEELDFDKKIEIEAVGSFGTEFRIKSDFILTEERDFIKAMLEKEYEDISVSEITKNPEANYNINIRSYILYLVVIMVLGFGAIYLFNLFSIDEELNIKSVKGSKDKILEEANKEQQKEKKLAKKLGKKQNNKKSKKESKEKKLEKVKKESKEKKLEKVKKEKKIK